MGCLKLDISKIKSSPLKVVYRKSESEKKGVQRFTSVDPLADVMPGYSPYSYTFNNPLKFTDPDGRIPNPVAGAIAGGLIEFGAQMTISMLNGESFGSAFNNVDWVDVGGATIEGAATSGGSALRRLATTAAIEITSASIDISIEDGVEIAGVEDNEGAATKSFGDASLEATIGMGSNILVGDFLGGFAEHSATSGLKSELKTVSRELKKSMKGSIGETTRKTAKASIEKSISTEELANQVIFDIFGQTAEEVTRSQNK